jgi:hypothetical protein
MDDWSDAASSAVDSVAGTASDLWDREQRGLGVVEGGVRDAASGVASTASDLWDREQRGLGVVEGGVRSAASSVADLFGGLF